MSTRGLYGFVIDGEVKAGYNHFDSYPSGLGFDAIKAINSGRLDADKVRAIEPVSEDFYQDLRDLQGDWIATQEAGKIIEGASFAADSLFCEWGYLINLDNETLEVYRGFNTSGKVEGRFADIERYGYDHQTGEYDPITLVLTIPFADATEDLLSEWEQEFNEREDAEYEARHNN